MSLRDVLDEEVDDLPRYFAVTQPDHGWLPSDGGEGPTMKACVYIDDVRDMLRRKVPADTSRAADLLKLLEDVEPFIGWLAEVPELKERVARALRQNESGEGRS